MLIAFDRIGCGLCRFRIIEKNSNASIATKVEESQRLLLISRCHEQRNDSSAEWGSLIASHSVFLGSGYEFSISKEQVFEVLTKLPEVKKWFSFEMPKQCASIRQIFIVGTPRSSTTLLETILLQSDHLFDRAEESTVFAYAVQRHGLLGAGALESFTFTEDVMRTLLGALELKVGLDCDFTEKSLENVFLVDVLLNAFPNARVICCERKPMASAVSILKRDLPNLASAHDTESILQYFDAVFSAAEVWEQRFPKHFYRFSYEQFLTEPEVEGKRVYTFCRLEWSDIFLNLQQGRRSISKAASSAQISKGVDASSLNRERGYEQF